MPVYGLHLKDKEDKNMRDNPQNRQNYSRPVVQEPEVAAAPIEEQPAPVEAVAEPAPEKVDVTAVVTDCLKLNVRKEPRADAEIVTVIPALSEVVVDLDASSDEFYKVCTAAGIEGFCMKKFIAIRK